MAYKVLIPQAVAQEGVDFLTQHGYEVKNGTGAAEADLVRDVEDCDAILLRTAPCTRAVLEAGKKLKIVARHGAGYNNVDLKASEELGIYVTNAPDSTTNTVAEFTIGAMIVAARNMFPLSAAMKNDNFYYKNSHKGVDLAGRTLAVVGFGRIGRTGDEYPRLRSVCRSGQCAGVRDSGRLGQRIFTGGRSDGSYAADRGQCRLHRQEGI